MRFDPTYLSAAHRRLEQSRLFGQKGPEAQVPLYSSWEMSLPPLLGLRPRLSPQLLEMRRTTVKHPPRALSPPIPFPLLRAYPEEDPLDVMIEIGTHYVGRSPTSEIRIRSKYVSAEHAAVDWNGVGLTVLDLASTNGTTINGYRIEAREGLHDGDLLRIGPVDFRVILRATE